MSHAEKEKIYIFFAFHDRSLGIEWRAARLCSTLAAITRASQRRSSWRRSWRGRRDWADTIWAEISSIRKSGCGRTSNANKNANDFERKRRVFAEKEPWSTTSFGRWERPWTGTEPCSQWTRRWRGQWRRRSFGCTKGAPSTGATDSSTGVAHSEVPSQILRWFEMELSRDTFLRTREAIVVTEKTCFLVPLLQSYTSFLNFRIVVWIFWIVNRVLTNSDFSSKI